MSSKASGDPMPAGESVGKRPLEFRAAPIWLELAKEQGYAWSCREEDSEGTWKDCHFHASVEDTQRNAARLRAHGRKVTILPIPGEKEAKGTRKKAKAA